MLADSDITFVVLNPEGSAPALSKTVRTIGGNYPASKALCVVGKDDESGSAAVVETVRGGGTITSLIDAGVGASNTPWCFVVTAGTHLRYNSLRKYKCFLKGEKEVLYQVVERRHAFDEASINGVLLPKRYLEDVGGFGECRCGLQFGKMLWALAAMNKGYVFKALVGAKII